jgi:3-oxoacyl-[acyl-carrier protein] reductase
VDTDMAWEGIDGMPGTREEAFELAMREVPLRRMSQPEEIAATVAWLLSPDATGVTGQGIDHNNGAWMI